MRTYAQMMPPDLLTLNDRLEGNMSFIEMEKQDHARYIKHLPVEAIEHLGEVKESSPTPAADPFLSDSAPYPLSPDAFTDDEHFYPNLCEDATCICHSDCEPSECEVCLDREISRAENEADAAEGR